MPSTKQWNLNLFDDRWCLHDGVKLKPMKRLMDNIVIQFILLLITILGYDKHMKGHDQYINSYDKCMKGHDKNMKGYDRYINGYDKYIKGYDNYMKGYDQYINAYDKYTKDILEKIFTAMTNLVNSQFRLLHF